MSFYVNTLSSLAVYEEPKNPCLPSPCGLNSICRVQDGRPVCSCKAGYLGAPPNCRPECVVQSECPLDKACFNQKCVDPCPGTCGFGARCRVVNHNPICSCPSGFTGDPFTSCVEEESKLGFHTFVRPGHIHKFKIENCCIYNVYSQLQCEIPELF